MLLQEVGLNFTMKSCIICSPNIIGDKTKGGWYMLDI